MNHASSVISALYRRKLVVLAVFIGAMAAGAYYATRTPTDYAAKARVLIPAAPPTISLNSETGNLPNGPTLPDSSEDMRIGVMGVMQSGRVHARMAEKDPTIDRRRIRKNVVGNIGRDSFLELVAYGRTAEEAVNFANLFAESFEEIMQEDAEVGPRNSLASFTAAEPLAWERYRQANEDMTVYLQSINSIDLQKDSQAWSDRRRTIQTSLVDLELGSAQRNAERPVLEALAAERPEFRLTRQQMGRNGAYTSAMSRVQDKATELAIARLEFTDKHPTVIRLESELALAQANAQSEAELVQSSMTSELDPESRTLLARLTELEIAEAGVNSTRDLLQAEAATLDTMLAPVPKYRAELDGMMAKVSREKDHATDISRRRAELEFHLEHGLRFTISGPDTRAKLEEAKAIPTPTGIYLFSAFAGLLIGILLAILMELIAIMRLKKPF